ncbi:MAG: DUF2059 domain-containing protein [Pseudomonadota bacterium]
MKAVFPSALATIALLLAAPTVAQEAAPSDAPAANAPSEAKLALAQQIVDDSFPEDMREEMFFATVDQMTAQMREATLKGMGVDDQGAIAVMDAWLAEYIAESKVTLRTYIPKLMDGLAKSYAVMFTQEELTDIAAFVATPSGQRFMTLSSAVLAEPNFASANQEYMNEVQSGLPAAMQDLQGRLIEYMTDKKAAETDSET